MTDLRISEFRALRATIGERGTARPILAVAVLAVWAGLAGWIAATPGVTALALAPLVVLYAGFEAVAGLHLGVERIGRYLQVFHERSADAGSPPGWEATAMAFGRTTGAVNVDPLFSVAFLSAVVLNLLPAAGAALPQLAASVTAHALVALRIVRVRVYASRQRQLDLARFAELAAERRTPGA